MTKQHLWQSVYIEAMRQSRINDPKELADKAVKDYEERFDDEVKTEYDFFKKVLLRFNMHEIKVNPTVQESSGYIDLTIRDKCFSFGFEDGKLVSIAQ